MECSSVSVNPNEENFLYFAFGSNLLTQRIHINNPSAQKVGIGKVLGYKLDFKHYSEKWKGAVATIVEKEDEYVFGVLWKLNFCDLENLDRQEGVSAGIYQPIEVLVDVGGEEMVKARSYQLLKDRNASGMPSFAYYNVILSGAREHGLPEEYIEKLKGVQHNGYKGPVDVQISLPHIVNEK